MTKPSPLEQPPQHTLLRHKSFWRYLLISDWLYALLMIAITIFGRLKIDNDLDIYETVILWGSSMVAIWLGWFFKPLRWFFLASSILAYEAMFYMTATLMQQKRFS